MEYQVIRTDRKTVAIQVTESGQILVRAPRRCQRTEIEKLLREHHSWIQKQQKQRISSQNEKKMITPQMRENGYAQAKTVFPARAAFFAARMGVNYGRITIREQKTRWGSCSSKGNLNFNWKLTLMPAELLDYVVVHELAHRIEMNHSPRFWRVVEQQLPDYRQRRRQLQIIGRQFI